MSGLLASLPPIRVEPGARAAIRAARAGSRRLAVLDDDPTGSQTVHDVPILTVADEAGYRAGLAAAGGTFFVLTNTRSLAEPDAVALDREIAGRLFELAGEQGLTLDVVSRSDSTLRGHVLAEVRTLDAVRREALGSGYDGVLLVPAFLEAGRFTARGVHWARVGAEVLPVGQTEFARDATFGYASSDLRDFVVEKSGGSIARADVVLLGIDDIRLGGPDRVADILRGVSGGAFVVVDAVDYADLEIVVLGLLAAQRSGRSFLHRTGPSFVQVLAGLDPQPPLDVQAIWPDGHPGGHGLVVVGSHVGLTSRQVEAVLARHPIPAFELEVAELAGPDGGSAHVADIARRTREALAASDVLVFTSRRLQLGSDGATSLALSRRVSTALTDVVAAAVDARPSWVVAKGGITSHDVAVRGLGIRRAQVLGQLFTGTVSVFRPLVAAPHVVGMPYVVFAGNVGDEQTLADVVDRLSGRDAAGGHAGAMPDVGWIGLGAMGAPMSVCVARAGMAVTAFDIDPARAAALAADGVRAAESAAAAAAGRDVVVLMVATPAQGEQALFGPGAAAAELAAGTVVLVMSTVGPAAVASWAERLAPAGVEVVDAPVSGGVARAGTGDLLVLVGGPAGARRRVQPLIDAMAATAPVVGDVPGDGQRLKLVNQLLCGVHIAVAGEALAFAEALGLDPGRCWEILGAGAAASFMFNDRGERMAAGAFTDVRSALDIFVKDMGLVVDAARAARAATPLATAAERLYLAGHEAGLGRLDDSSVIEVLRHPGSSGAAAAG